MPPALKSEKMAEQKEQEIKGWSDLPGDVLRRIAEKLNHIDDLRFHSVCKQWRLSMLCQRAPFVRLDEDLFAISPLPKSSLRFPLSLPLIPMSPDPHINSEHRGYFKLSESIIYLLQESPPSSSSSSSCSWLLRVEECFDRRSWRLLIPLSRKLHSYLYPWFVGIRTDCVPKYINLVDFEISEIGRSGTIQFVHHSENSRQFTLPERDFLEFRKVAVSPTPWPDEYGLLAITFGGKMAFCNLEVEAETWTLIQVDLVSHEGGRFIDVIYHRNKFYALADFGLLVVISQSLETEIIQPSPPIIGKLIPNLIDRLVEYRNDLYLIHEKYYSIFRGLDNIFKLNEAGKTWEKVDASNIDDLVFFIGDDWSSAVSARNFAGLKPCHVYISDELLAREIKFEAVEEGMNEFCGAIGVCNLNGDRIYNNLCAFWDQLPIFWPPPAWLKPDIFGPHMSLPYESDIFATKDDHGRKIEEIAQSQWRTGEIVGESSGVDKEEEKGTSADDGKEEEKGASVDEEE